MAPNCTLQHDLDGHVLGVGLADELYDPIDVIHASKESMYRAFNGEDARWNIKL